MKRSFAIIISVAVVVVTAVIWSFALKPENTSTYVNQPSLEPAAREQDGDEVPSSSAEPPAFGDPLTVARTRVSKKPFGIYLNPQNSPVSPERFTGYHTGADFETMPKEQAAEVPVYAVCAGKLLVKEYASGYGGVAVQSCTLDGMSIAVVYGHLRLASISAKVGTALNAGDQLGVLGSGYSTETDGERKHLHLGVHQGSAVNIRGYVATKADLADWIDPLTLIK